MKTQIIQFKKPTKESLLALRRSAQKIAAFLKSQGISEDEIIAEFNASRKQAMRETQPNNVKDNCHRYKYLGTGCTR